MAWRRREDADNPAWPGMVDVFGFTLAFLLLLWFAANWPEKVKDLETRAQGLNARIASVTAEKRQLQDLNRSLEEKLLLQEQSNQSLTDQVQQLTDANKNLDAQLSLLQGNNLDLSGKVQQLTSEKAALRDIGLKDWEDLLKLLQAKVGKAHMTIIPNRNDKEITLQGKPLLSFPTTRFELSPGDRQRLQLLAPILFELRQQKKFFITINGTADPRELQTATPPRNNTELSALRAAAVAGVLEKAAPGLGLYLRVTGLGVKGKERPLARGENPDEIYRQYRTVNLVLKIDVAAIMQQQTGTPAP